MAATLKHRFLFHLFFDLILIDQNNTPFPNLQHTSFYNLAEGRLFVINFEYQILLQFTNTFTDVEGVYKNVLKKCKHEKAGSGTLSKSGFR